MMISNNVHRIVLGSPQTMENNELFKNIIAMYWIALSHQPYYRGFTRRLATGSPNMVCMVNYAIEDLEHRIVDFFKYYMLHCHVT